MSKSKSKSTTSRKSSATVTVMVLNDGETFTDLEGCRILVVPLKAYEKAIADGGDARDLAEVALQEITLSHLAF